VAPSAVFARDLESDYRIDPSRVHVVPNPVDLDRFSPDPRRDRACVRVAHCAAQRR
jgi:glycosyltransferase involved in cell wall biosynthesis